MIYLLESRRSYLSATAILAFAVGISGCASQSRQPAMNEDAGTGDTDSNTSSTSEGGCESGEHSCYGNDVYECTNGEMVFFETCADPLVCINGVCVTNDDCGWATAYKSNVGCVYYAVDMENDADDSTPGQPYAIAVSNLDVAADAHVSVERRTDSGWTIIEQANVSPKTVKVFFPGEAAQFGTYHLPNLAFRITSDLPVVAYQFNPYSGLKPDNSDICSNDGSLLIPVSGLDKAYYALGYPQTYNTVYGTSGHSSMNIVAVEDNTVVTINPSQTIPGGNGVSALVEGGSYAFTMQAADVIQLSNGTDISGTYIEADKRIAVFSGSACAFVPASVAHCDHVEHQLFPIATWGHEFVAAHSPVRSKYTEPESDYWRVIASENGTYIETDPPVPGLDGKTMNAGQIIEVSANYSFAVSAGAPVMIGQFLTGDSATDIPILDPAGDPAFALLPPIEQFTSSYVFLAPEKYAFDYAVITHPAGLAIDMDGSPISSHPGCTTETLGSQWEITRCPISDFTHTIDATKGVGISVWGYGVSVSYGYTGGLKLATINIVD